MEDKKVTEEGIKNVLDSLVDVFNKKAIEKFDDNFPKVREWIEKFCKNDPYEIADHFNSVRLDFENGSKQFLPKLRQCENKKYNWVAKGIFDGSFIEALEIKCDNYTDMVRKFFKAVYKQITDGEIVNVYNEHTKEEITEWYNGSKWAKKDFKTLEECLEAYVGTPKLSLKEFKTSEDIIEWYYNSQMLYRKICKVNLKKTLEEVNWE